MTEISDAHVSHSPFRHNKSLEYAQLTFAERPMMLEETYNVLGIVGHALSKINSTDAPVFQLIVDTVQEQLAAAMKASSAYASLTSTEESNADPNKPPVATHRHLKDDDTQSQHEKTSRESTRVQGCSLGRALSSESKMGASSPCYLHW